MALLGAYRYAGQRSTEISACEPFGDPAVDVTGSKAPHRSELKTPNNALPRIALEGLGMNAHDGSCLICIEQRFRKEGLASYWFADWP